MRRFLGSAVALSILMGAQTADAAWRVQPTPSPGTLGDLADVSCPSPGRCMAVGAYAGRDEGGTLSEWWNGVRWVLLNTPNRSSEPFGGGGLSGVSCPSQTTCVAVGHDGDGWAATLAEVWRQGSWTVKQTPNPGGPMADNYLRAVSCPSQLWCTAVGHFVNANGVTVTLAEHWDGRSWSKQFTPNPSGNWDHNQDAQHLTGISCSASNWCVAVGNYLSRARLGGSQIYRPLAERWDGRHWRVMRTPHPGSGSSYLGWVSCTSASACTAAGHYFPTSAGRSLAEHHLGFAERWNGRHWSVQHVRKPTQARNSFLSGVSCASQKRCTAVGIYDLGHRHHLALAERWDGRRWILGHPRTPGQGQDSSLSGVSCPSERMCTAVGFSSAPGGYPSPLAEGSS